MILLCMFVKDERKRSRNQNEIKVDTFNNHMDNYKEDFNKLVIITVYLKYVIFLYL